MSGKDKDEENEKSKPIIIRNTTDYQRLKLEKLMKNPDKPVIIPERPKERGMPHVPDFVRNVMGSSAGAGSGEFHVYRHLRRKEYARQKFMSEKAERERLNDEYQQKIEDNKQRLVEKTAKKRAKRLKRKVKQKSKAKKPKTNENVSSSESNSESEDEESMEKEKDNQSTTEKESTVEHELSSSLELQIKDKNNDEHSENLAEVQTSDNDATDTEKNCENETTRNADREDTKSVETNNENGKGELTANIT